MKRQISVTETVLHVIGRKGTYLILETLQKGSTRFTTLEKVLKVSPRTLSERLKELEEHNIVKRIAYPEVPPRVEYSLTEKGEALEAIFAQILAWNESFAAKKRSKKK
ncbi:MAG: winged helix-turn-helix transcriptional regulator [Deinococcales bacterium]